ncbi:MAG: hypothetical protein IJU76_15410 [Desulfovibrionaceae bacterium]|nr:hypothetical protein [Desulfovibrionaceae bacterium]
MIKNTIIIILVTAFIGGIFSDSHILSTNKVTQPKPKAVSTDKATPTPRKTTVIYRGISRRHLESVIYNVLAFLGEEKRTDWTRLLLLTAMAESDCGRLLKQVRGPAQGIMQTEPETERDVLRWTKARNPDLYDKVRRLRVPARLGVHEAQYNLSYSIALAYLEYVHRRVSPVGKSHAELAKLHKVHYNTIKGRAKVENTIKKSQDLDESAWLLVEGI